MENKYLVLSVTTLGSLMSAIDSTIVYLALPSIGKYFNTGISYLTFIIIAYMVASTSTMIPSGIVSKKYGKKKIYLLGFFIFTLSSLFIVISPNVILIIILRGIEGIGAGILATVGIPLLMDVFPQNERGKAVGINSISWGIGTLIGPLLGGFLVMIDWRLIFLINIPIGTVAIIFGIERIPHSIGIREEIINIGNIVIFLLFIIPLTIGLSFLNLYFLIVSFIIFPIFLMMQIKKPLIPLIEIKNKIFLPIVIASTLQALGFFGVMYSLSIYMQNDLGVTPFIAGIILSTYPISAIIANPLGGYILDKYGSGKILMILGLIIQGSFLFLLSLFLNSISFISLIIFISGFGGSIYWVVSTTIVIDSVNPNERTLASSTLYTMRNISLITGISSFPLFIYLFDRSQISYTLLILNQKINIFLSVKYFLLFIAIVVLIASIFILFYKKDK
ncbi:MAG: MFS transporter [Thermoplasmata archaeon]